MTDERRFVMDANVLLSALLFEHSTPGQAFYRATAEGRLLISRETVAELSELLARPKFDRYLTRDERELFLQALIHDALLIEVSEQVEACRDPKDDKYLALAIDGQATCIVSGDADLLVLQQFRGIPIVSPAQFLESID